MKIPVGWLSEWVPVPWSASQLGSRLTLAGFELESLTAAAPAFSGVVVARIERADPHPQAHSLRVCRVSTGPGPPLTIVCGAANARSGLKSALALAGARLPDGRTIQTAVLRGVESQGMLASAKELGLGDAASGILEFPQDAPLGEDLREYLRLDEPVLDINVTPNRGDAMSVLGIAREVAALGATVVSGPAITSAAVLRRERFPVRLDAPAGCPRFAACIVRGIDNTRQTPPWLRERLRRGGLRAISPVVDVTNYVMLELGQPMHAYDLGKLRGGIVVRLAQTDERLMLLDGRTVSCAPDMLLITDDDGAVGLAGI
ncbi:MAG: phenylalanine--tRNA ligase subunit beta, partial [Gammaproteobacteria bacterium]|nr:phenylalanine--tRNA ligase subunit beta [Gammaproteobacteria bacterium]